MEKDKEKKAIAVKEKQAIDKSSAEPTKKGTYFMPNVDIFETEDGINLVADMPGVDPKNLDVDLREGVLTITGSQPDQAELGRLIYQEYEVGGFMRRFQVGEDVDQGKITAKMDQGVLKLVLPKADAVKPRKITVQTT